MQHQGNAFRNAYVDSSWAYMPLVMERGATRDEHVYVPLVVHDKARRVASEQILAEVGRSTRFRHSNCPAFSFSRVAAFCYSRRGWGLRID